MERCEITGSLMRPLRFAARSAALGGFSELSLPRCARKSAHSRMESSSGRRGLAVAIAPWFIEAVDQHILRMRELCGSWSASCPTHFHTILQIHSNSFKTIQNPFSIHIICHHSIIMVFSRPPRCPRLLCFRLSGLLPCRRAAFGSSSMLCTRCFS